MLPGWLACLFAYGRSTNSWADLAIYLFVFGSPLIFILFFVIIYGCYHTAMAWFQITTSSSITNPATLDFIDGPELFVGIANACARTFHNQTFQCSGPTIKGNINIVNQVKILQGKNYIYANYWADNYIQPPPVWLYNIIIACVVFTFLFAFVALCMAPGWRESECCGEAAPIDSCYQNRDCGIYFDMRVERITLVIGFWNLVFIQIIFWTLKMWWDKSARDYNEYSLIANVTSGGFVGDLPPRVASSTGTASTAFIVYMILSILTFVYIALLGQILEDKTPDIKEQLMEFVDDPVAAWKENWVINAGWHTNVPVFPEPDP